MKIKNLQWDDYKPGFVHSVYLLGGSSYRIRHESMEVYFETSLGYEGEEELIGAFKTEKECKEAAQKHWENTLAEFIEA